MRALYVDAFSGISGNMFMGALLDLGVPEEHLRERLGMLNLPGYELSIRKVMKCGIASTYAEVNIKDAHEGGAHGHRGLSGIVSLIDKSLLDLKTKQKAIDIFVFLARAEAKVHGIAVEDVHFHEVGAADAIVDIVSAAVCLDWLSIESVFVSRVRTGFGFTQCGHGRMPVPAPATVELLRSIPFYEGDIEKELATPTGAAILAAVAQVSQSVPDGFVSERIGYGAGSYDLDIPNALRVIKGEIAPKENRKKMLVMETNIDDMNPQIYSHVINKLFAAGASDAWVTPIIMKKGRPACLLSVLLQDFLLDDIAKIVFSETSTLGVRYYSVGRNVLERYTEKIKLPLYGDMHIKYGKLDGKIINMAPEFEDCSNLSALTGRPIKEIWQAAMRFAAQKESE
ncbi:MAG: nickel pincer cofactor biosynthesis protein LarC [Acidaminococcales bacterium]|jgi:uncharacterized protein (TIGR00299 family) protein|nr:nickel pincer cofactor biosynthesis protein LarC [Acidaminococcales bacterium]